MTDHNLVNVSFRLNGLQFRRSVPTGWTLLRYLRDELGYHGTKCGCEIGECGACTVILNGEAINSCLVLAAQIDGADLWTIEGVTPPGGTGLHPVQKAFVESGAVHCGFCSPGMVMSVVGLLMKNRNPSREEIKSALEGNLCRCSGYVQVIEAARTAAAAVTGKDLDRFFPQNAEGKK